MAVLGVVSVDYFDWVNEEDFCVLGAFGIVGVFLFSVVLFMGVGYYLWVQDFRVVGMIMVLVMDCNFGSFFVEDLGFVIMLGCV